MATGEQIRQKANEVAKRHQMNIHFELTATPYMSVANIGTGAYGVVCKAMHVPSQRHVAIKKIPGAFGNQTLIKRTLRELRILRNFHHENIIAVMDMFRATSTGPNRCIDIYMVMDLMETDLHQIIYSQQPLTDQHFQYFLYQILRGLKYIHSAGVVHRDLKPSNLLINADCLLKIGDFGMARAQCGSDPTSTGNGTPMTQYVATRWYRAPELLCSIVDYGAAMDIWSVGCILAEMIMRRQLFPGQNARMQVQLIVHYLGVPENEFMSRIHSDTVRQWIIECGARAPLAWTTILPKATPTAIDLASKLMMTSPWRRLTAVQAIEHPYLCTYHDVRYEPDCPARVIVETDRIERLNMHQIKAELEGEVGTYQRPTKQTAMPTSKSSVDPQTTGVADENHVVTIEVVNSDVDMLSAGNENATTSETNNALSEAKQALREQQRAAAVGDSSINTASSSQQVDHQLQFNTTTHPKITAHERRLEREEKRRRKLEKQLLKLQQKHENKQQPQDLTEDDQKLMARWEELQKTGQRKRLEGQIVDIISQSFATNIVAPAEHTTATTTPINSGQLMSDWLQATGMDTQEQLQIMCTHIEAIAATP